MQRWMNAVLGLLLVGRARAADPAPSQTGRVLIAVGGDLVVAVGEQADAAIVVNGHLSVLGTVNAVVVVDGTATVTGTTIESLVVVRGSATVANTHVRGDIRTFDAQVSQTGVTLDGGIHGLETDLVALGWALGVGALLIWLGIGLATLVAGLAAAGLGRWALELARGSAPEPERPYVATVVGLVLLFIAGIVPLLTAILSFLGFGAVVVAAWRTVRGVSTPTLIRPTPAPLAG